MNKLVKEGNEILKNLSEVAGQVSNLYERLWEVAELCLKITTLWWKGGIHFKEKFQKLLFPEGIIYDKKNGHFELQK